MLHYGFTHLSAKQEKAPEKARISEENEFSAWAQDIETTSKTRAP